MRKPGNLIRLALIVLTAHLSGSPAAAQAPVEPAQAGVGPAHSAEHWEVSFFHDEEKSELEIYDLYFSSAAHGAAAGVIRERGDLRPVLLLTSDEGRNWKYVPLKEPCWSLHFVDESHGWMAGESGIHHTRDGGQTWERTARLRGIRRVHFISRERGWAVGDRKTVLETSDGGRQWTKVPAAGEPATEPDHTTYGAIGSSDSGQVVIAGWSAPPRPGQPRFPTWMDPVRAKQRQLPTLTILLQSADNGTTWSASTSSMFGRITRVSLGAAGRGLVLVDFQDAFEWPSEVHAYFPGGRSERIFREKNTAATDVMLLANGEAYLAAVDTGGALTQSPVPGRLKILRSRDYSNWETMDVDYRAAATWAVLASAEGAALWVATDTGMILKLAQR